MDQPRQGHWGFYVVLGAGVASAAVALWLVVFHYVLEPSPRAPVSRVQSDQVVLAHALEAYAADANTYPAALWQLTTPTAYTAYPVPEDPFTPRPRRPLVYVPCNAERGHDGVPTAYRSWVLVSVGPDHVLDLDHARDLPPGASLKREAVEALLAAKTYDPSNGTRSRGDIVKWGGAF